MPYVITKANGDPVVVPDQDLNESFSVDLVGRNSQDYGTFVAQNTLRLLENYARATPPRLPTTGQVWYDTNYDVLRVWEQDNQSWTPLTTLVDDQEPTRIYNQTQQNGVMYYNTDDRKLYININSDWQEAFTLGDITTQFSNVVDLGYPSRYGSRIRTIYLYDINDNVHRAVLALTYVNSGTASSGFFNDEKIMAIFSGHTFNFTVDDRVNSSITEDTNVSYYAELSDINGIGTTIVPGLNLRNDNQTRVEFSDLTHSANVAFALNTGSSMVNGANIVAGNVYHKNIDSVPGAHDEFTLGNASTVFSDVYATNLNVGNGTTGNIIPNGNSVVNLGSANSSINEIFVGDITVAGNIIVDADTDIGSNTTPIQNIYANTVTANTATISGYTLPQDTGNIGEQMYFGGNAEVFWADPASNIADVVAGNGVTANRTTSTSTGPSGEINQDIITLEIQAGTGLVSNPNNVAVNLGDFTTDDLSQGSNNLYFSNALSRNSISATGGASYDSVNGVVSVNNTYIRNLLSAGTGISYNSTTGQISLDYSTPFENLDPSDFVTRGGTQTVFGNKTFTGPVTLNGTSLSLTGTGVSYNTDLVFTASAGSVTMTDTGDLVASGDLTAFSDIALKENLEVIDGALDKVKTLTGYTFSRKDKPGRHTGLVAQDVEKVLPEAVTENQDLKSVAYGNMLGLIVESIKDLEQQVQEIKKSLGER